MRQQNSFDYRGQSVLVKGPFQGLGKAYVADLGRREFTLRILPKTNAALERITESLPHDYRGSIEVIAADLLKINLPTHIGDGARNLRPDFDVPATNLEARNCVGSFARPTPEQLKPAGTNVHAGGLPPGILRRCVEYLDANLESDISLADLAQKAGMRRSHLIRTFRQSTGKTPHQFLLTRRIEKAQLQMLLGVLSLTEIALATGFANQHHLARVFRRVTGMTPSQYRLLLQSRTQDMTLSGGHGYTV